MRIAGPLDDNCVTASTASHCKCWQRATLLVLASPSRPHETLTSDICNAIHTTGKIISRVSGSPT